MYLRLVRVKAVPAAVSVLQKIYTDSIIPALSETPGCLHASLMQSSKHPEEFVSLTLWETVADAEAYVESGRFAQLMDLVRPHLQETTEWRLGLSHDMKLEYAQLPQEPAVSAYPISLDLPMKQNVGFRGGSLYLRIVSVTLKPDKKDEYHRLYLNEIIPALQATAGCLHAYLIMPSRGSKESLSVTIWDSKESAEAYERNGQFATLVNRVKHTFTNLVQWKVELDPTRQSSSAGSEDLKVEGFNVVAVGSFE
ncbi:MAG: antibiotic biosynthesis monooxygenase [Ignavibacteriales bacterium]|nr:antibiotic biosynthesis monooxygenase [Ignavibacteriales bacterium]